VSGIDEFATGKRKGNQAFGSVAAGYEWRRDGVLVSPYGRIDLSGMLTHRFRLAEWRDAFSTIVDQGTTGAIKVAFDFR